MTFNFDTSELTQTAARRVTPHDNCIVTELSSGAFPRYIKVQLPDEDGAQKVALWDGSLDLEVNDEVYCHEYAEISIWRIMAMGGNDSGAGKVRVSKVWESDFGAVALQSDATGQIGINTASPARQIDISIAGAKIHFSGTAGGNDEGITYKDTGGGVRNALAFPGSDVVALSNRASNGTVQILANTATAGAGGEVIAVTVEDDRVVMFNGISGRLGVGIVPVRAFHFFDSALDVVGRLESGDAKVAIELKDDTQTINFGQIAGDFFIDVDNDGSLEDFYLNNSKDLGIGTTSPGSKLHILDEDAITAAITDIITIGHNSTGSPISANFGAGLLYQHESTTSEDQDAARIAALWTTATHASRASALVFETLTAAGSLTEQMRIAGNGVVTTVSGRKKKHTLIDDTDSPYTVLATDEIIFVDTDTAAVTVNLPAGAGQHYRITNTGSSANDVIVDPNGSEQLFSAGAGVSFALVDAETINIYFESTKGWW